MLTPQQEARLQELEKKYAPQNSGGLAPHEEARLQELEQKYSSLIGTSPQVSKLESAGRGLYQGSTAGFGDELRGLTERGINAIHGLFGNSVTDVNEQLAAQGFKGDIGPTTGRELYEQSRNEDRAANAAAQKANPYTYGASNIVGSFFPAMIPGLNIAKGASIGNAALKGGVLGGLMSAGNTENDILSKEGLVDIGKGATVGAILSGAGQGIANKIDKAQVAKKLRNTSEKLAENATGATGITVYNKFDADAGRQLLDRGLVGFGDSAENIAKKVGLASDEATRNISAALQELDDAGVTVDPNVIIQNLKNKSLEFSKDPSQQSLSKELIKIVNDIKMSQANEQQRLAQQIMPDVFEGAGEESIKLNPVQISKAEITKRGFQKQSTNWLDPKNQPATKEAYLQYMKAVEDAALKANPELASKFKEAKKTYGLLDPIREASEKRAFTLQQSPLGGLQDAVTAIAGASAGDPSLGLASVGARRLIAPRVSSSLAVSIDKVAQVLESNPQVFGKFKNFLERSAAKGPQALTAAYTELLNKNTEFRRRVKKIPELMNTQGGLEQK